MTKNSAKWATRASGNGQCLYGPHKKLQSLESWLRVRLGIEPGSPAPSARTLSTDLSWHQPTRISYKGYKWSRNYNPVKGFKLPEIPVSGVTAMWRTYLSSLEVCCTDPWRDERLLRSPGIERGSMAHETGTLPSERSARLPHQRTGAVLHLLALGYAWSFEPGSPAWRACTLLFRHQAKLLSK